MGSIRIKEQIKWHNKEAMKQIAMWSFTRNTENDHFKTLMKKYSVDCSRLQESKEI